MGSTISSLRSVRFGVLAHVVLCGWLVAAGRTGSVSSSSNSCQPHAPGDVIGVAHNAGDHRETIVRSLDAGADVIEIDLRSSEGELISAHNPLLAIRVFSFVLGEPAESSVAAAATADGVLLDLKQSDAEYLHLVEQLIETIDVDQIVYLSSPDVEALDYLAAEHPSVVTLLTIRDGDSLGRFLGQARQTISVRGVSIQHGLINADVIRQLCGLGLLTFAWPVDDPLDALTLIAAGVDGITTGNLEILAALGPNATDLDSVP